MNVFIDDIRNPPSDEWVVIRNSQDAIAFLHDNWDAINRISFDHDLGGEDTIRPVILYIEEAVFCNGKSPHKYLIHSANPVGRMWIENAIKNITSKQ